MKLWVKTKGADNKIYEFVFDTDDYSKLNQLMVKHGLSDYHVVDWKLRNIKFFI